MGWLGLIAVVERAQAELGGSDVTPTECVAPPISGSAGGDQRVPRAPSHTVTTAVLRTFVEKGNHDSPSDRSIH